jgi:hypothetical protein
MRKQCSELVSRQGHYIDQDDPVMLQVNDVVYCSPRFLGKLHKLFTATNNYLYVLLCQLSSDHG